MESIPDPTLPFIDLHRHLDGSVRLTTILELGRQHHLPLPAWDVEKLRPSVQVTKPQNSVMEFIGKFKWMVGVLVDDEAVRRIAYENVLDAKQEGIDYIELRFSPWFMAEPHQLDPKSVVAAVIDGINQGRAETGMKVNLIGILSRGYGVDIAWEELNALLSYSNDLVAIDLAGDEAGFPGKAFVPHFRKVREYGLQVTIHAGEAAGPDSIWQAIQELGASRIGHAVSALRDPALLQVLREEKIGIETNLTSNVQTSTVPSYAQHPLRAFLEAGLLATINSDDPGISGIDLNYEYQVAAPAAGLSAQQIRQCQINAVEVAFLSAEEKKQLLEQKRKLC